MKKIFLFLFCSILPTLTLAQNHLQDLRNKTARQIANSPNGTRADSSWANSRIGTPPRDLAAAIESRSITPFDLSGTNLIATKDTAVSRSRVLVVPKNYSAAALTFKNQDSALVMVNYTTINITASDTIPVGAEIFMEGKGRFQISSGVTLYIAGRFSASRMRRFYGGGVVRFANGAIEKTYPEWFGASNDSTTTISDSGPAVQLAVNATPNGGVVSLASDGRTLQSPKGYVINTTVRIPSERSITIEGNGATIYSSASDTVFLIQNGSQTSLPSYAINPTTSQPRHVFERIRFKRITGATGTGVAVALINSTGQTFNNIDVADYNNAFVFHNISDGWCENNEIFNSRIAGCDTAISYMLSLAGNNSMATNSLRKVTITRFTDSDVINQGAGQAVGIFSDTGTNLYRNVWDQVVIFPKDSVTCVNIDGKAEDLTGTLNFEYIGSTATTRMRGFHFGANSSELRFDLHMNLTGRVYFAPGLIFYSQIPGSFGYSGITTTFDGNHNHGTEVVVDSTKFTTLYGIIRNNNRISKSSIGDSARIFFANVNNSDTGKLDLRARRNAPIEFRSMADGRHSSATANSIGGSTLPLQPVRLLDIGGRRTANDSTTLDVRNTTDLLFGSDGSAADLAAGGYVDQLTTFTGGIAGQQLFVNFADDSVSVANLSGASGSGRLFLIGNRDQRMPKGTKAQFFFESESGGVFAREVFRHAPIDSTTWNPANLASGAVDSVDVTYVGAMIGDPVVVGFTGIRTTTADFDLRGHVVTTNTIRVYVRNRNAGTYNLPSGSLKYKVVF